MGRCDPTADRSAPAVMDRLFPPVEPPHPGWRRPGPGPAGARADAIAAGALCVAAVITMPLYPWAGLAAPIHTPLWLELVWSVLVTLPLAWRRRRPNTVAVVVSALFIAGGIIFGVSLFFPNIALFTAFYTVGAWDADRQRAGWSRAAITAAMFCWLVIAIFVYATKGAPDAAAQTGPFSPLVSVALIQLLTNATFFAGAHLLGNRGFAQAVEHDALVRRTEELAQERERTTAQALALERMRIARDLHDVVAHHVSVMGVQASAARIALEQDPPSARTALGHVESSARTAVEELRGMLSTLRDWHPSDGADRSGESGDRTESGATVGVRRLPALVEETSRAGLPTRLELIGSARPLPSVIDVNVYRLVQEALTNVRKHAGPTATADVRLRFHPDEVEIEVTNSGRHVSRRPDRGGLGQLGMRERVAASRGSIELGPLDRGGYLVRARFPVPTAGVEQ